MDFIKNQLELINSKVPNIALKLENIEVFAFFSLGQMDKKIVRLTDNFFQKYKSERI